MKSEQDFVLELEKKAREQKRLMRSELLPSWAKGMGEWLVVNPWRVLVPGASILYLVFRMVYGISFREGVLWLFGGY